MDINFSSSPVIPDQVYSTLPTFFTESAALYSRNKRRKDVFNTSLIAAVSGCLRGVTGIYDGKILFPNLYSFIVAPAASGKGVLSDTKYVIYPLHEHLLTHSSEDYPFRLLTPGDNSAAMILQILKNNEGHGVMIETEADTVGRVLAQDWGNFNDKLRANFHNEPIQWSRKGGNEYFEIKSPKLSVAVSGTPNQVRGIIPSSENGLFSRFIFYAFTQEIIWSDISGASANFNLQEKLEEKGEALKEVYEHTRSHPFTLSLSESQWVLFNNSFKNLFDEAIATHGDIAASTVYRMGVMAFKMAMIFTCFRRVEEDNEDTSVNCNDDDLQNVIALAKTYLEHSKTVLEILPKGQHGSLKDTKKAFLEALPSGIEFTRSQSIEIGVNLQIPDRTVDRFLFDLVQAELLKKEKMGRYKKIA